MKLLILLIFLAGCSYEPREADPNIRDEIIGRLYQQQQIDNFWKAE